MLSFKCNVMKHRFYWKMSSKNELSGPFAVSERWPALPTVIDSAFEDKSKKLYFFSGKHHS